jgi:hypothetical protein
MEEQPIEAQLVMIKEMVAKAMSVPPDAVNGMFEYDPRTRDMVLTMRISDEAREEVKAKELKVAEARKEYIKIIADLQKEGLAKHAGKGIVKRADLGSTTYTVPMDASKW